MEPKTKQSISTIPLALVEEAEVLADVGEEEFGVEGGVLLEDFHDGVLEGAAGGGLAEGEGRAEGDGGELAAAGFVEVDALVVGGGGFGEGGDAGVGGGDVVAGLVLGKAASAVGGDFAEEFFIDAADGAEGFEVVGAGGLDV